MSNLISLIDALLDLDAKGALVPHGIGGHARTLFQRCKEELNTRPAEPVEGLENLGRVMNGLIDLAEFVSERHKEDPGSRHLMSVKRAEIALERAETIIAAKVEQERLRFEGELDKWMKTIGASVTGYQPEAYALMDLACQELVKLRADNARLRDSSEPMATDPDEWTATEEGLAHLLINVVGAPDDVTYTPDEAQGIIEKSIKGMKADNAALTARVKEREQERDEYRDKWQSIMEQEKSSRRTYLLHTEALESQLTSQAAQYKDLEDYAREATKAITGLTGGGSEYFGKRIGEVFTADIPFCLERIRGRYASKTEVKRLEKKLSVATGALGKISDAKTELNSPHDYSRGWNDALFRVRQIARAALEDRP
ncbi:hypothetical protein [Ochrobactrum sp. BTU1]|uniref:hypothetical protein n=1 Tax=Ochrobactrum sp. BTU1 TaxID=2840456 RepID=UPI001C04F734|nr:hypothetical protein KMS41_16720 [Ochrobactrum sp. BTU1]